jgi:hypothetical protein
MPSMLVASKNNHEPRFLNPRRPALSSAAHAKLLAYTDYHGSYAVLAQRNIRYRPRLLSFGRTANAVTLYKSIMHSFRIAKEFYELFYVDANNKVYYDQAQALPIFRQPPLASRYQYQNPGQPGVYPPPLPARMPWQALWPKNSPASTASSKHWHSPNPLRPATLTPTVKPIVGFGPGSFATPLAPT